MNPNVSLSDPTAASLPDTHVREMKGGWQIAEFDEIQVNKGAEKQS